MAFITVRWQSHLDNQVNTPTPRRTNTYVPAGFRLTAPPQLPSGMDDPPPYCVADESGRIVNVELLHQMGSMGFGGLQADPQAGGHLLGPLALGNQLQDFTLPGRQRIDFQRIAVAVGIDDDLRD